MDTDPESWEWTNGDVNMDTLPLDLDSLLEEAEQSSQSWAGLPGSTIVGHIHLHVSNLVQAETFYAHGLGFEVVLRFRGSASFLSTEKYHHHVGVNIWNGVDAPRPPKHNGAGLFPPCFPQSREARTSCFRSLMHRGLCREWRWEAFRRRPVRKRNSPYCGILSKSMVLRQNKPPGKWTSLPGGLAVKCERLVRGLVRPEGQ